VMSKMQNAMLGYLLLGVSLAQTWGLLPLPDDSLSKCKCCQPSMRTCIDSGFSCLTDLPTVPHSIRVQGMPRFPCEF
jgi:hypothetical protein